MASFGIPAWAARTANIFAEYAPFSWVAAGFLGMFIATLSFALFAWARGKLQIVGFRKRLSDTSLISPLDKTFEDKRLRIQDLAPPVGGIIQDKVFVNCDIVGPANALFLECFLARNSATQADGLIVKEAKPPINGFAFLRCSFTSCRFYAVTFMVPDSDFRIFSPSVWPGINWITETPEPDLLSQLIKGTPNQDEEIGSPKP